MATVREKVVQYLQDARAAEYALTTMLAVNIAVTPEGDYRRRLESQRQRSRERVSRVSDRLGELGVRRSIRHLGMDIARVTGGQAVALATVPVQLLRGPGGEERVLKNARDLCAATGVLDANYRALAQIAHTCRDERTAKLAVDLQAQSEEMLSECYASLDRLAEAVVFAEVEGEPVYQIGRIGAVQMLGLPQLRESMHRLRDGAADVLQFARREAVRQGARSVIPDYDNLSVEQIRDWLTRLSQLELATVEAYERVTLNRIPILETIQKLHGAEPWPEYDRMNVGEIRARLREVDEDQIRAVLDYERGHKDRSSILNAPEVQVAVAA
ncbi:hypothetical protein ABT369_54065 [Dactylosporangium sp. NPDC000244]|uniref:hypothetical protein n=1 Tax=Dactylosporangium sp. NPDC000244 TaxID=3154365 RepID=UPI0033345846